MGMPISLALRGAHIRDASALDAWSACLADLRVTDRVFSTYRDDSHVSRLRRIPNSRSLVRSTARQ